MVDDDPVRKTIRALEDMSLEDLAARIEMLEGEITACKEMISKKQAQKLAADALFGGSGD